MSIKIRPFDPNLDNVNDIKTLFSNGMKSLVGECTRIVVVGSSNKKSHDWKQCGITLITSLLLGHGLLSCWSFLFPTRSYRITTTSESSHRMQQQSSSLAGRFMTTLGLGAGVYTLLIYSYIRYAFHRFITATCHNDLKDIPSVYFSNGGTFLVAVASQDDENTGTTTTTTTSKQHADGCSNNKIVGIVGGKVTLEQQANTNQQQQNFFVPMMELRRMSVDKAFQQRGIGKRMVKQLLAYATNLQVHVDKTPEDAEGEKKIARTTTMPIQEVFLTCSSAQYPAHALYRSCGFIQNETVIPLLFDRLLCVYKMHYPLSTVSSPGSFVKRKDNLC